MSVTYVAVMAIEELGGVITTLEQKLAAWQAMIDAGVQYHLAGWYVEEAQRLIDQGLCTGPGELPDPEGELNFLRSAGALS
jgi:hypothetical protein